MTYRIVIIAVATKTVMDIQDNATFEDVVKTLSKYHNIELYAVNIQTTIKQ